jgi:hypothetical protein
MKSWPRPRKNFRSKPCRGDMNLPAGIFHESFCIALARYYACIAGRSSDAADRDFYLRRADAFIDCVALPPSQMRLVLSLSEQFPQFCLVRDRMFCSLRKRPPVVITGGRFFL